MNDPYHVYMDLDVINSDYNATSKPQLRFEETRNTPFLAGDSADYFCSVVRFSIQTGNTLPVFIPRIQPGQSDVNKTIYQVAIVWDTGGTLPPRRTTNLVLQASRTLPRTALPRYLHYQQHPKT